MPSINDVYSGGASLKAADLNGKRFNLEIASVSLKEFDEGNKLALSFQRADKVLILNKTNANIIAHIAGTDDYTQWAGTRVTLYSAKVDFQGRLVDAIRIEIPDNNAQQQASPAPAPVSDAPLPGDPSMDSEDEDSIPF